MRKTKKKILIVKPRMTIPRYHFNRTMELAEEFDITYIINSTKNAFNLNEYSSINHKIIFLDKPLVKGFLKNTPALIRFYIYVLRYLKNNTFDIINIDINRFCFLLPLFRRRNNYVLQMYTSSVGKSRILNFLFDLETKVITLFFKKIFIGTKWMEKKFNLTNKQTYVVNWGTMPLSTVPKLFDMIKLLYVGTLTNRELYKTVQGLSLFLENNKDIDISYDIIGTGSDNDIQEVLDAIRNYKLDNIVHYHGFVADQNLPVFFEKCNVGVAFIPIKDYYNNVVATKLYEYYVSGLFSIATKTSENIKVINSINGVLIEDSAQGFLDGLIHIRNNLDKINPQKILEISLEFNMKHIAKRNMIPMYYELINK